MTTQEKHQEIRSLFADYQQTRRLSTRLMLEASQANFYWTEARDRSRWREPALTAEESAEICAVVDRFHALAKVFEGAIWYLGGVQKQVNACNRAGMSGTVKDWSVLIFCCAGRCLLTFTDKASQESLTLITADGEESFVRQRWGNKDMGPMGIQGLDCTEDVGRRLLERAITEFPAALHPDEHVGIG